MQRCTLQPNYTPRKGCPSFECPALRCLTRGVHTIHSSAPDGDTLGDSGTAIEAILSAQVHLYE